MRKLGAKKFAALVTAMALVTIGGVYATWSYSSTSGGDTQTAKFYANLTGYGTTSTSSLGEFSISKGGSGTIYYLDQYSYAIQHLSANSYIGTGTAEYDYLVLPKVTGVTCDTNYIAVYQYNGSDTIYYYDVTSTGLNTDTQRSVSSSVYPNYTAALGVTAGSSLTIGFQATDATSSAYNVGVDTTFSFDWSSGVTEPQLYTTTKNTDFEYYLSSASGGEAKNVFTINSTTATQYIYTYGSTGVNKSWDELGSGAFEYEIESDELCAYLCTAYAFVLDSYDAYDAMNSALSGVSITLTVTEAGTVIATPSFSLNTGSGEMTITAGEDVGSYLSGYYVGLFANASDGAPAYILPTNGTISSGQDLDDLITSGIDAGTYIIRIRAVSTDSTIYANSAWSSISTSYYTVVVTTDGSGTVTGRTYASVTV